MKSIIYGVILMIAISAVSAGIILNQDRSSSNAFSSLNGSVRLDN